MSFNNTLGMIVLEHKTEEALCCDVKLTFNMKNCEDNNAYHKQ